MPVIRYVVTQIEGIERVLIRPAQGRFTFATEAEAQEWLDAVENENSGFYNKPSIMPAKCYDEHYDPMRTVFSDS